MVAAYVADLRRATSAPRLERYRRPGDDDLDMVVNYVWNVSLSEVLYPSLAALEVSLRNGLHRALSTAYGTEFWFYEPGLLEPQQLREFANARFNLYKLHGNQPTAGRIVAELNFGFWTTILSRNYHNALWNPNRAALLRSAFPHLAGPLFRRDLVHRRYNSLRFLRNRVFHHEPIWLRPRLAEDHRSALEAIGWASQSMLAATRLTDRFPEVHASGRTEIAERLRKHLGVA